MKEKKGSQPTKQTTYLEDLFINTKYISHLKSIEKINYIKTCFKISHIVISVQQLKSSAKFEKYFPSYSIVYYYILSGFIVTSVTLSETDNNRYLKFYK